MSLRSMNMIWLRLDASRALPSQLRGRFGDFAACDDEGVVDEDSIVVFGVKDLVGHDTGRPSLGREPPIQLDSNIR
jgi:hypothetical protein